MSFLRADGHFTEGPYSLKVHDDFVLSVWHQVDIGQNLEMKMNMLTLGWQTAAGHGRELGEDRAFLLWDSIL